MTKKVVLQVPLGPRRRVIMDRELEYVLAAQSVLLDVS